VERSGKNEASVQRTGKEGVTGRTDYGQEKCNSLQERGICEAKKRRKEYSNQNILGNIDYRRGGKGLALGSKHAFGLQVGEKSVRRKGLSELHSKEGVGECYWETLQGHAV